MSHSKGPEVVVHRRCPDKWCPDCKRLIGVGCACGMTFAEKIKSVAIDKTSLQVRYPGQYST